MPRRGLPLKLRPHRLPPTAAKRALARCNALQCMAILAAATVILSLLLGRWLGCSDGCSVDTQAVSLFGL